MDTKNDVCYGYDIVSSYAKKKVNERISNQNPKNAQKEKLTCLFIIRICVLC